MPTLTFKCTLETPDGDTLELSRDEDALILAIGYRTVHVPLTEVDELCALIHRVALPLTPPTPTDDDIPF